MKPTKEEIRLKAIEYARKHPAWRDRDFVTYEHSKDFAHDVDSFCGFAESLFKETEEETFNRLSEEGFRSFEFAKKYHEERKIIENE